MAKRNVVKISEAIEQRKANEKRGPQERAVIIHPPKFEVATVRIRGTAPYVQHAFSEKAAKQILISHVFLTLNSRGNTTG